MHVLSLSSKAPYVNSGGGNESSMEEGLALFQDTVDGEILRDTESRETDVVDGTTAAAEINHHHKGSADKHKFNTLGYQASDVGQEKNVQVECNEVHLINYHSEVVKYFQIMLLFTTNTNYRNAFLHHYICLIRIP